MLCFDDCFPAPFSRPIPTSNCSERAVHFARDSCNRVGSCGGGAGSRSSRRCSEITAIQMPGVGIGTGCIDTINLKYILGNLNNNVS